VFAHPAYVSLFEDDKIAARAFLFEDDDGALLYPFLLRRINAEPYCPGDWTDVYDMVSPYGYGGPEPVYGNAAPTLYEGFYQAFERWAMDRQMVSEFVRFSLFSESYMYFYGKVEHRNDNIVCDLLPGFSELWSGFSHKVRKNVAQAQANGISILEDPSGERLDDFIRVFYHTLERRRAASSCYWPASTFYRIIETLPGKYCFFHALKDGAVVASELVLISKRRIYSFLGGTLQSSFSLRPGDLLKYHIIHWGCKAGFHQFVIGGGYKYHDGIFAFKKAFAPQGIFPFFTGSKIFNKELYDVLAKQSGKNPDPSFFPGYR
jgi:hypothetical protein